MMDNKFMDTVLNLKNVDTTKQPMFLGEDLSLQRYDRFKYPKFFDLWRKQEEYHWLPEEVSLTCLLYTSPSPRDRQKSRMPSSA